jgi:hypothetical protein
MPIVLPSFAGTAQPAGGGAFSNDYSLEVDGTNGYLSIPSSSDFGFGTGDFSISCWINAELDYSTGTYYVPFDFRSGAGTRNPVLFLDRQLSSGTSTRFQFYNGSATTVTHTVSRPITGQWVHFVYTRSGTTGTMYLDGASVATGTDSGIYVTPGQAGRIGQAWDGAYPYDGKIDEFAIFDSVLSASNVTDIYNSGTPVDLGSGGLNLSPLGYWRMGDNDGGTGSTVSNQGSTSSVDGTLQTGSSFSTDVPAPITLPALTNTKSLTFDGSNDHVLIDTGLESSLTSGAVSVSVWFDSNDYSSSNTLFSMGDGGNHHFYILPSQYGSTTYLSGNNGSNTYITFANPSTGSWHNIIFIMNGASSIAYLNGVPKVAGKLASSLSSTGVTNPTIGKNASGTPWYMDGEIDEVAIWNSALTGAQCKAIYNNGVPADLSSLNPLGWWRMGDGDTFPTLTDHGSGSNNAAMTNMGAEDIVSDVPS